MPSKEFISKKQLYWLVIWMNKDLLIQFFLCLLSDFISIVLYQNMYKSMHNLFDQLFSLFYFLLFIEYRH